MSRAFLVQVPPTLFALIMVAIFSELPGPKHINTSQSPLEKLKRIDFRGAFLLTTIVLSLCLILDLGGSRIPWTSHWIIALTGTALACSISYIISAKNTLEPIFPIQLATQPVVFKHYFVTLFQAIAFNALMVYVPVYFQVAALASTSQAGMFLVPSFLGNTLGGLFAGAFLRRSKRFKVLNLGALLSGLLAMNSLWLFWNGASSPWLCLLTFPLGFGMGALFNSVFVGLATQVQEQDVAIATSGLFLFFNLGAVAGVSGGSAVFHNALRKWLGRLLSGVDGASEVLLPPAHPQRIVGLC
jgi:predicted MFS family arabinose efflux permease